MKETISVIVPVYKVEAVLGRCVESILAQSYEKLEIILVDDGSPDGCPALCDAYEKKDSRIRVLHKENGGLTAAWKAGVAVATGAYLGFVDSDDWIDADMYQRLLEQLEKTGADIAMTGLRFDYEDKNYPPRKEGNVLEKEFYEEKDLKALYKSLLNDGRFIGRRLQPSRVTKLFRREIVLENLALWDERVTVGEDLQMVFASTLRAKSICQIPDYYPYHYWYNQASMTGQYDGNYLSKIKLLRERLEAISDEIGVYDFRPQIRNDFLSLAVMAVKNEIWRNHKDSFAQVLKNVRIMCRDISVQEALANHSMDKLGLSVKLYLFLMRHSLALPCYVVTKIFFSFYYGIFSHVQ